MLSVRRIASGSVHLWKREMRSGRIMAPFSSDAEHQNREVKVPTFSVPWAKYPKRQVTTPAFSDTTTYGKKSCYFGKIQPFISETLDFIISEEEKKKGVSVTKEDLVDWATQLEKEGKHFYALEIYEWMDKKKMEFSPEELASYVDVIIHTQGFAAAKRYFNKVEPVFDRGNYCAKNWPAFNIIVKRIYEAVDKYTLLRPRIRRVRRKDPPVEDRKGVLVNQ